MGSHRSKYRPGIIFRSADFYLMYAEALNEVSPDDPRVIEYIDKVRERAGIPLLKDIKPQIVGNTEAQREAIIRERRVELATEGQRYFDVRRWMIAGNTAGKGGQGGNFHGMDMSSGMSGFYDRTVIEKRRWQENMYLAPPILTRCRIADCSFRIRDIGLAKLMRSLLNNIPGLSCCCYY